MEKWSTSIVVGNFPYWNLGSNCSPQNFPINFNYRGPIWVFQSQESVLDIAYIVLVHENIKIWTYLRFSHEENVWDPENFVLRWCPNDITSSFTQNCRLLVRLDGTINHCLWFLRLKIFIRNFSVAVKWDKICTILKPRIQH